MSKIILDKLYRNGTDKMNLSELPVGMSATVQDINLHGSIKRRLYDLGLIKGTRVKCLLKSPKGSPIAYNISGAVIALRSNDLKHIIINCEE